MQEWRKNILRHHLVESLTVLELVLSAAFFIIYYGTGNVYFKGVGIGLVIAWVTSGIAYLFKTRIKK